MSLWFVSLWFVNLLAASQCARRLAAVRLSALQPVAASQSAVTPVPVSHLAQSLVLVSQPPVWLSCVSLFVSVLSAVFRALVSHRVALAAAKIPHAVSPVFANLSALSLVLAYHRCVCLAHVNLPAT